MEFLLSRKTVFIISVCIFICFAAYLAGGIALSKTENVSFNELSLCEWTGSGMPGPVILLKIFLCILSFIIYFILGPIWTLLFRKSFRDFFSFFAHAFIANTIALISATIFFKLLFQVSLTRVIFLLIMLILSIFGLCGLYIKTPLKVKISIRESKKGFFSFLLVLIILIAGLLTSFNGKVFVENFSASGYESLKFSQSLKKYIFVRDELEYGNFQERSRAGTPVVNPNFVDCYLTLFFTLLLGVSEAAIRLPFFIYLLFAALALRYLIYFPGHFDDSARSKILNLLFLSFGLFLYTIAMFFYTGYNAFFTDISVAPVRDTLFVFFLFSELYFLLTRNRKLFLSFAIFSALTLYSGPIFTVISLLAYWLLFEKERKRAIQIAFQYLLICFAIILVFAAHGYIDNSLSNWLEVFKAEYINDYSSANSIMSIWSFLKYFLIISGGITACCLAAFRLHDKISRFFSIVAIGYLLIVLASGVKEIHYLAPIVLFPLLVFLRLLAKAKLKLKSAFAGLITLVFVYSYVMSTMLCWPKIYTVHTSFRELGEQTCLMFDAKSEQVGEFFSLEGIFEDSYLLEAMPWEFYAKVEKEPSREYSYYFTPTNEPPRPDMHLIASTSSAYLWGEYPRTVFVWSNYPNIKLKKAPTNSEVFNDFFKGNSKIRGN